MRHALGCLAFVFFVLNCDIYISGFRSTLSWFALQVDDDHRRRCKLSGLVECNHCASTTLLVSTVRVNHFDHRAFFNDFDRGANERTGESTRIAKRVLIRHPVVVQCLHAAKRSDALLLAMTGGGAAQLEADRRLVDAIGCDLVLVLVGARVVWLGVDDHRQRQLVRAKRASVGAKRHMLGVA